MSTSKIGLIALVVTATFLGAGTSVSDAWAQSKARANLVIDTENVKVYRFDTFDAQRLATEMGPTVPLPVRTFMYVIWLADVVAVNGAPAKGSMTIRGTFLSLTPNPSPGQAISDTSNSLFSDWIFDIQQPDGSPVGSLLASGWMFGRRPAGFDSLFQGNLAIVGGTGAFLGARGQGGEGGPPTPGPQAASVTEDPSNRRELGGARRRYSFQLIPASGAQ